MQKLFLILIVFMINSLQAMSVIRDEEIESFFQEIVAPLQESSELPGKIKIYLLENKETNAFTDGIKAVYVNSGLLRKLNEPAQLIGILAHELAHIKAEHHALTDAKMRSLSKISLLVLALGTAGALAGGKNGFELGTALTAGGSSFLNASYLKFSQEQESVADNMGITFLYDAGYDPIFLVDSLKKLKNLSYHQSNECFKYFQTHPPLESRINFLNIKAKSLPPKNFMNMEKLKQDFIRILAKLDGYYENKRFLEEKYKNHQNLQAYSMIVNAQKKHDFEQAESLIAKLEKNWRNDVFLLELKGENLKFQRKLPESIAVYHDIAQKFPKDSLINLNFLFTLSDSERKEDLEKANLELQNIVLQNQENYVAWHILAKVAVKMQNQCLAYIAFSKIYCSTGNVQMCKKYKSMLGQIEGKCSLSDREKIKQYRLN